MILWQITIWQKVDQESFRFKGRTNLQEDMCSKKNAVGK